MKCEIQVNGYIGPDDFFSLMEGGSSFNLKALNEALSKLPADCDEIDVMINSGGGLVSEGFAIHDRLKTLDKKVNTVVLGMCGSIATVIAQGNANGGTRKMHENSDYFIHNPFYTPTGPDAMDADDLRKLTDELQKAQDKILNFYHEVTGTKKSELKKRMNEAISLTSAEAKSLGFIDEVIETTVTNQKRYALAAFVNAPKINNTMLDLKKEFEKLESNLLTKLRNFTKPEVKNEKTTAEGGTAIYHEGALGAGTKVYSDEAMTIALADGDYMVEGKTYKVAGGEVTEVVEPAAAVTTTVTNTKEQELQAEIDRLKAENTTLAGKVTAAENEVTNAKQKVTEVEANAATILEKAEESTKAAIQNFKSNFFTGDKLKPEFVQAFKGNEGTENNSGLSPIQIAAKKRREKEEAQTNA